MTYKFWPLFKSQWRLKHCIDAIRYFFFSVYILILFANAMDWVNHSILIDVYVGFVLIAFISVIYFLSKFTFDLISCIVIYFLAKRFYFAKKIYESWIQ